MDQSFSELAANLGHWTWFIAAAVLAVIELIAPGVFFIWLAAAAGIVGLLLLIVDIPLAGQIVLFAVLSVIAVWASRRYLGKHPITSDRPLLNQRAKTYIGNVVTLDQPILNGRGKLRIGDTQWLASGPDLPTGTAVRIVDEADGILVVEAAG